MGHLRPPWQKHYKIFFSNFFIFFFHFRCILLQISHQNCFFISISIPGRSGVNYVLLPNVLNTMYRKNCEIHSYNTRSKNIFRISSGTQTFSNISARIWNSLMVNLDIDVSLIKFKESLKQYLLNNVLIIKYTK